MDITQSILYIHPTFEFGIDFKVTNDSQGNGDVIYWYNTEYTQPTQAELDAAWIQVEKKMQVTEKVGRLAQINQELLQLGGTNELSKYSNFNTRRKARIEELKTEFEAIETDLTDNYEDTLVDNILDSLFG